MDLQQRLTAFAMLGATWVLWLLVGLSIVSVTIAFERAIQFFTTRDDVRKLKDELLALLRGGKVADAKARLKASPSFEARVVAAGLEAVEDGAASAEERMAGEAALAKVTMERNLAFLGTVGNNAPFVGLLGTVIGIIKSFHMLESSSGQVSAGLMAEIGEALVATAIGILVALPAVAAYNYFQRVIKTRLARADALGREVLAFLKAQRTSAQAAE